jgi:hypothetical protein
VNSWKSQFFEFYEKYKTRFEIFFFIGGFAFDAVMVSEPDDLFAILQQIFYLSLIGSILHHELLFRIHRWRPEGKIAKVWIYRDLLLHFLLGTLLNIYSIFYIKSASLISSLIFLILMIGFIVANEAPVVKRSKVSFKIGLYAICLFSFLSILVPVVLGFVGWIPFTISVFLTGSAFYFQFWLLKRKTDDQQTLFRAVVFPALSVVLVFSVFYSMGWIPPVPLSAKEQGIYHNVEKQNGKYLLSFEKPWWKFWASGDQSFKAQSGDKVFYYIQIYSPARFSDEIYIRWLFKDAKRGWQTADRVPLKIVGGRKDGFRGFSMKSNYQPGDWRVQVETNTGQEISRMYFEVSLTDENSVRQFKVDQR